MLANDDSKKISIVLLGLSIAFYLLGIIFFFDRAIQIISNILFVVGMVQMIGKGATATFFMKPKNLKKSICFFGGFFIIAFLRYAFIGALVQIYSLFLQFKSFMPILWEWIFHIPGVGGWLKNSKWVQYLYESSSSKKKPAI